MRRALLVATATTALAGCRLPALDAHSIQAGEIAQLSWVLFGGGAAILLLVVAAAWLAVNGSDAVRRRLADPRTIVACGLVLPTVVLGALLVLNVGLMRSVAQAPSSKPDTLGIAVTGEQWWWRVVYSGTDGRRIETANEIRIPVGRDVVFTLASADVIHAFWIPSLGGKMDMIPGRETRLRVHATRPGVFRGPCAEYCGGPHALMTLHVTAMPAEEFEAWLAQEHSNAAPAPADGEREGAALFQAAGCGTCHAVRGTAAAGTIGPDLTHVGSRQTLGAGSAPLDGPHLARFIVAGQTVKPGNKMPEFRFLSDTQRDALVAYLLALR